MLPWLLCTEFEQVGSITVETAVFYSTLIRLVPLFRLAVSRMVFF